MLNYLFGFSTSGTIYFFVFIFFVFFCVLVSKLLTWMFLDVLDMVVRVLSEFTTLCLMIYKP